MTDPYRRYSIQPERALSIWGCAAGMLSSLHSLEQHEKASEIWLADFRRQVGSEESGPARQEPSDDAQAVRTALVDRLDALRRDLADLAADAESCMPKIPEGASRDIVVDRSTPPPSSGLSSPLAFAHFSGWYAQGVASHFRTAGQNARHLVRHLANSNDEETEVLCDALQEFIRGVHGPGSD